MPKEGKITRFAFAALLLALWLVPAGAQYDVRPADCLEEPAGFRVHCAYVVLPQDYADPERGSVEIYVSVIQAASRHRLDDPLVYLVGGPGSSGTQLLRSSFRKYLNAFAGQRDIVVIDQRGTGLSNPPLYCREALYRLDEILQSRHADHAELALEILDECQRRLAQDGVFLETFHSASNARDIVNVLLALGYEEWNLVGVSYGSRLALRLMRDYPQYLRSVILDSVYPPQADIYLDAYYHGERALNALFAACAASSSCAERYPDLGRVFYSLYERLNQEPMLEVYTPPRYKSLKIEISGYRLYDWAFGWLYEVNSIRSAPKLIYELQRGIGHNAARLGVNHQATMTSLSLGMHYAVQCQEEYPSAAPRDYAALLDAHPHLRGFLRYPVEGETTLSRLCGIWGASPQPASVNDPVRSDVPALLLSGHFDPITPPAYADMARRTLSASYSFVLPHVGHGVLRSDRCAVRIAAAFIDAPRQAPEARCIGEVEPLEFD